MLWLYLSLSGFLWLGHKSSRYFYSAILLNIRISLLRVKMLISFLILTVGSSYLFERFQIIINLLFWFFYRYGMRLPSWCVDSFELFLLQSGGNQITLNSLKYFISWLIHIYWAHFYFLPRFWEIFLFFDYIL